jgi:hypothetical protein
MTGEPTDLGEYCRAVENYLCRRNDGHLVRVVGPAFDCVAGWAAKGVPLRVAYRGIDRCVDRFATRPNRRRPVRIEFCDADVLDVFDEWRRAVLRSAASPDAPGEEAEPGRRHASLTAHLDRVVARRGRLDVPGFKRGIQRLVNRAGLLMAGDLNAALEGVVPGLPPPATRRFQATADLVARVDGKHEVADLMVFATSAEFGRLRRELGLAVTG